MTIAVSVFGRHITKIVFSQLLKWSQSAVSVENKRGQYEHLIDPAKQNF